MIKMLVIMMMVIMTVVVGDCSLYCRKSFVVVAIFYECVVGVVWLMVWVSGLQAFNC